MSTILKPPALQRGDKVALVSLSSGILGEAFCAHQLALAGQRLSEFALELVPMTNALKGLAFLAANPAARAADLKQAFADPSIKGIICAIGGTDTFRLAPYLLDDAEFCAQVQRTPKIFTGFSDTTINHLMLYKLGLSSFYGPNILCDLAELDHEMLPYSKAAFARYFEGGKQEDILSSPYWYEERSDFSPAALGTARRSHEETRGYELLQGPAQFRGWLLGGCLESLCDLILGTRHPEEVAIAKRYQLLPSRAEWAGKICFLETSEEQPTAAQYKQMLQTLAEAGIFAEAAGLIVGKPQNEAHYAAYKAVLSEIFGSRRDFPILYNVNFGHAYPRTVLAYGAEVLVDAAAGKISYMENILTKA